VERALGRRAEPGNRSGVGRDFRLKQNNVHLLAV
jgi:hypothetical protein